MRAFAYLLATPFAALCQNTAADPAAYPTHALPPIVVPGELGGEKFKLHTTDQDSAPFPPHRIIGNLYYVGQADYASYLITTQVLRPSRETRTVAKRQGQPVH